ncbi:hypothetical protein CYMTET_50588 [Cymbomonas tetramitiformis]|uniref:Uncharacterized protein n=1 Tax=Cymbomonas tetramitiformis TaxID=36881 RepID=A0AAE0ETK4_9CHLO|nr:hypothetical protein CYMTET_50588 [Cymbomonas tetramitiformis]
MTVPCPGDAKAQDTAAEVALRKYYRDQQALVKDIRSTGRFRKWTKSPRETVLGGKASRFGGTANDVGELGRLALLDLVKGCVPTGVRHSHQEDHAALRYPARISLKRRIQLIGRVYGRWLATQIADQDATVASALAVGTGDGVDHKAIYKMILDKIQTLEHFIRTGKTGLAATKAAHGPQGGLNGFRSGLDLPGNGNVAPVAFDPKEKKAVPCCGRCARANRGTLHHVWKECPLRGVKSAGTTAAFCCPIDDDPEQLHALALCQIYQDAADEGQEAFAAVCGMHGALAVLGACGAAPAIDYSVYGFTVGAQSRGPRRRTCCRGSSR